MSTLPPDEAPVAPPEFDSARRPWLLWLSLVGLAVLVGTVDSWTAGGFNYTADVALRALAESLYPMVPMTAAVAVGMSLSLSTRTALQIVVLTTLLMVGLDVAGPSTVELADPRLRYSEGVYELSHGPNWRAGGAIGVTIQLVKGELPGADERLNEYPAGHGRSLASLALVKLWMLLAPVLSVGIVVGVLTWTDRRVIFRSARDEFVARSMVAWATAPLVVWVAFHLSTSARVQVLFGGASLGATLVPYVPISVLAALGWVAFIRSRHQATRREMKRP